MASFFLLLFFLLRVDFNHSAKILAYFPSLTYSHQLPLIAIAKDLASRGHLLTVITPTPIKENIKNYHEIDVSSSYNIAEKNEGFQKPQGFFHLMGLLSGVSFKTVDSQLKSPELQKFIHECRIQNCKYDLFLYESLIYSAGLGLMHLVGSPPSIGVLTLPYSSYHEATMGMQPLTSATPECFRNSDGYFSLWERCLNTWAYFFYSAVMKFSVEPVQDSLLRKYFGNDPPPSWEMENNKSLLVYTVHPALTYSKPVLPSIINIGAVHIKESGKVLPKDIEEWMSGAEEGVIYFSLGSKVKGISLPPEKVNVFKEVFSKLPRIRVLWKWEDEKPMEGLSANVLTRKWFSQQEILSHKKMVLFITQGGCQSLGESLYNAVPVLGIPYFADQNYNMVRLEQLEVGFRLPLESITTDNTHYYITSLIYDKKYKDNLNKIKEQSITPEEGLNLMDKWVNFLIKHGKPTLLEAPGVQLNWIQYNHIDVFFVTVCAVFIVFFVILMVLLFICKRVFKIKRQKQD